MSFRTLHLVDPELRALAEALAVLEISDATLQRTRDFVNSLSVLEDEIPATVLRSEIDIPMKDGTVLRALKYQHRDNIGQSDLQALMHIHGGGLIMGTPDINDARHLYLCERFGLTILAPSYRVAPEHPYPTPLNDCLDAWSWLHKNTAELGLDQNRIALSGDSAGGTLAAAASQYLRDLSGNTIAHLMLVYPMLDPSTGQLLDNIDPILGEFGWTAEMNQYGWKAYLAGSQPIAPANPSAATDLDGLPSCWIGVGSLDLFLDENIKYARRLIAAEVRTELKIYPAAIHGFPVATEARISQNFLNDYSNSLATALELSDD